MKFYFRWKFTVLLAVLLLVFFARLATVESPSAELIIDVLSAVVVIAAILTICDDRRFRAVVLILGLPAAVFLVVSHVFPGELGHSTSVLGRIASGVFLGFTAALIVRAVLTHRHVTPDTLVGAMCGYLLIGVLWTEVYCAVELVHPGSFSVPNGTSTQFADPARRREMLEYFSFVTLSTVGYGDIAPVARGVRALAVLEAIFGQFYLAVLVAGLVSILGNARGDSDRQELH